MIKIYQILNECAKMSQYEVDEVFAKYNNINMFDIDCSSMAKHIINVLSHYKGYASGTSYLNESEGWSKTFKDAAEDLVCEQV